MKGKQSLTFNHNPLLRQGMPLWRMRVVLLVLLLGGVILTARAAWLQGYHSDFLQAQGASRYARVLSVPASRGRILDRNGEIVAISSPVRSIWAIPRDAELSPSQVRQLAGLLDLDVEALNERLAGESNFVYLRRQISPRLARRVADLNLPGVHQDKEYRRFYPAGEVNAHVLGFTDVEDQGQEGVELAFDEWLRGEPGSRQVIRDRRGQIIEDVESIRPPRDGQDLVLALDSKIQFQAYSALRHAVHQHQAAAGSVVVLDTRSGEILAMANMPTFNPNNRRGLSGAQLRNRAMTDVFEPGSTIKPFIAALAMERGMVSADTEIETSRGRMRIGRNTVADVRDYGDLTVSEVIQKSSNVGTVKMAMQFEPSQMWGLFHELGFGQPMQLGFPGEARGVLRPASSWREIEQATMAYGHGLSSTLLHVARAYLAFARDGDLVPLSLLRREAPPEQSRRIFRSDTAAQMRAILELAASPEGTGRQARIPGYRVAGKTGTAHKLAAGRYTNRYISSFVGLAPVSDPRIVVAVMIDEPSAGEHFGGVVAAPVFARVAESALRHMGVAPDAPMAPLHFAGTRETAVDSGGAM